MQKHGQILFFAFSVFSFLGFSVCASFAHAASITMRVVAMNPSENNAQKIPVKVYLPAEIKPEHIIFKDDLDIGYDTQQSSYYVFGEYELAAKQTLEKQVELQDIWVIPASLIVAMRQEATELFSKFANTGYQQRMKTLAGEIDHKLSEIEKLQMQAEANPEQHISDYRYSRKLADEVRADLDAVKMLCIDNRPVNSLKLTWQLVIFVIAFLGVLSGGTYVIWQRQIRTGSRRGG